MMRLALLLCLAATAAPAEILVAARLIRPGDVLTAADGRVSSDRIAGALAPGDDIAGLEARRMLFPGRALMPGDLGPPRLVRRNDLVALVYRAGALVITAEGRSLSEGAAGDRVEILNITSRLRLSGIVLPDGRVDVSASEGRLK